MTISKNLNYPSPTVWTHHRSGWGYAVEVLNELHDPSGTRFFDWADAMFRDKTFLGEKWVGILHNVVTYPNEYTHKYGKGIYSLATLPTCPVWHNNMKHCKGIFTLSKHTAEYLRTITSVPVIPLVHPAVDCELKFSMEKFEKDPKLVTLGQWMRRYHGLHHLKSPWKKVVVKAGEWWDKDYEEMTWRGDSSDVELWGYLPNNEYDNLLQSSVVFLDLYDAAACNVILECIMRNTPVLVNRLPATAEYLGADYPLFYNTKEEAVSCLTKEMVLAATAYLARKDKSVFSNTHFRDTLVNSSIYKSLKPKVMKVL